MNPQKLFEVFYQWLIIFTPRLLISVVIVILGLWLIRKLANGLNRLFTKRSIDPSLRPFLLGTFSIAMQILLVLAVMQILTIRVTIFAALVGAFGVAAGLALSGTLQNFTSGILILALKPFEVGDNIIAQGQQGTVSMIRTFYTVVTTFDNSTVIIPNSKLSNEVIINLSREGKRRLDIELKFNYGIEFEKVQSIIENTIQRNKHLLQEPVHRIGVSSIDPDGYKLMIHVWVKPEGFPELKMQFQKEVIEDLKESGIKLPGM